MFLIVLLQMPIGNNSSNAHYYPDLQNIHDISLWLYGLLWFLHLCISNLFSAFPTSFFPTKMTAKSKVLKYVESASDLVILYIFMGNYNTVPLLQQEFAYFSSDTKHSRDKKCCDNDSFAACSSNPYYQLPSSNCTFITVK